MKKYLIEIAKVTFKGGLRDKVLITLIVISILCFLLIVPSISSLSMRQVREVSVSLSLSIISFVSLVLTIFISVNLVYKDMEKRYSQFIISTPVTRDTYIIGKFLGLFLIIGFSILVLSMFSISGIFIASRLYESQLPMLWGNYAISILFEFISLMIVASVAILFSSFSTNVFLPLFATIGSYIIGNSTQMVMDYIKSPYGRELPSLSIYISKFAYYIFPNLSAFDLKVNSIYSIPLSINHLSISFLYGLLYIIIILSLSVIIFHHRELI
jgi:ABC-type transport system involved in multi-copper enzyme maturation permease subunit